GPEMCVEVGYIGRTIDHAFQDIDLHLVPYMLSRQGQTFANAYANLWRGICAPGNGGACTQLAALRRTPTAAQIPALISTVPAQPFFESVLSATPAYCAGFANCTKALLSQSQVRAFLGTTRVSDF